MLLFRLDYLVQMEHNHVCREGAVASSGAGLVKYKDRFLTKTPAELQSFFHQFELLNN